MNETTILKSQLDIGEILYLYKELNQWDALWIEKLSTMHPIMEFSSEPVFDIIQSHVYQLRKKLIGKQEKMEYLSRENKFSNYWYVPGKLLRNEVRIFCMEKPQYDMVITILDL